MSRYGVGAASSSDSESGSVFGIFEGSESEPSGLMVVVVTDEASKGASLP